MEGDKSENSIWLDLGDVEAFDESCVGGAREGLRCCDGSGFFFELKTTGFVVLIVLFFLVLVVFVLLRAGLGNTGCIIIGMYCNNSRASGCFAFLKTLPVILVKCKRLA